MFFSTCRNMIIALFFLFLMQIVILLRVNHLAPETGALARCFMRLTIVGP